MARNNSIIGILINIQKAGNGDKQAIGALKNIQKTVGEATAIFGTLVAAGYAINKFLQGTVGEWMAYAGQVREVALATGQTSEESSRLIQILDDFKISGGDVTKIMKAMVTQGITPSVDNLALLSDEYLGLNSDIARSQFLLDKFGKSGLTMAESMNAGGAAIRQMKDEIGAGLILDDRSTQRAEDLRLEIDDVQDAWQGVKVAAGEFLSVLNEITDVSGFIEGSLKGWQLGLTTMSDLTEVAGILQDLGDDANKLVIVRELMQGTYVSTDRLAEAMAILREESADTAEATLDLADAEIELQRVSTALAAGLAGEYADAYTTYREKLEQADQAVWDAQVAMSELRAAGKLTADMQDDYNRKIDEGILAQHDAAAALERATSKMIYQAAVAGLDARSALKLAGALGLISEADYAIADAIEVLKERRDAEIKSTGDAEKANADYLQELEHLRNLITGLPPETVVTVVTNFIENGSPPEIPSDTGGGGGGGSGTCFLAGTLVATPNGPRAIETLRVGDPIVSMETERGERVIARVARVYHHPAEAIRGYLVINAFLRVTSDHPLYSSAGWKPAGDLTIGEPLRAWDGWLFVTSIERVDTPVPTYNIETDHATHNYFADGVLVHNKETEGYASGGVASGSSSGHWELLHGTEVVTTQSQFGDIMRAFSSVANGALGGGMNLSGATIQVSYSGNDFAGLLQSIQDSAGRIA